MIYSDCGGSVNRPTVEIISNIAYDIMAWQEMTTIEASLFLSLFYKLDYFQIMRIYFSF